eukprot:m.105211 g.105211  ORF g.105211 m.105211 type:complete len:156 (-) comp8911_c0_seq8:1321-1788(-)
MEVGEHIVLRRRVGAFWEGHHGIVTAIDGRGAPVRVIHGTIDNAAHASIAETTYVEFVGGGKDADVEIITGEAPTPPRDVLRRARARIGDGCSARHGAMALGDGPLMAARALESFAAECRADRSQDAGLIRALLGAGLTLIGLLLAKSVIEGALR